MLELIEINNNEPRQAGVSLEDILGTGENFTIQLALLAYKTPKFSAKEYQDEEITEFTNKFLLECISR